MSQADSAATPPTSAAGAGGTSAAGGAAAFEPMPLDPVSPQFTARAVLTGMLLGGTLSICNIYTGLTIGWGLNMSITASILAFGFWHVMHTALGTRPWSLLENNINQAAGSSAAAVSSAGLVAGIPALTIMTGLQLPWLQLSIWTFSVCLVGIAVAVGMRKQLVVRDNLPFPTGIAAAVTLREMHAQGAEALRKVMALFIAAGASIGVFMLGRFAIVSSWMHPALTVNGYSFKSLTVQLNPSALMYGVGVIIGIRTTTWLLLGSLLAWLVVAPALLSRNYIRLTVHEPLAALPTAVQLPPEPDGFAKYNADQRRLEWKGQMSVAEREALLARSDEPSYQNAVRRLHARSQREISAALSALPEGVALSEAAPVRYDAAGRRLVMKAGRGLTRAQADELAALSGGGEWRQAVAALAGHFDYETVAPLKFEAPLAALPRSFILPHEIDALVHVNRKERKLSLIGRVDKMVVAECEALADAHARSHPSDAESMKSFKSAVAQLASRTRSPLLADGESSQLSPDVRYDASRQALLARGILTARDVEKLTEAVGKQPELLGGVKALQAGSAFRPAVASFPDVVAWLLWPGVTLMVVSSLVSFAFSWKSIYRAVVPSRSAGAVADVSDIPSKYLISGPAWLGLIAVALVLSVSLQIALFDITWWAAVLGVLLSFVLALVAGRVAGETNTTPVGAMGKVTQLLFGAIAPASPAANLMSATVTGGAASQCADLLYDFRTGQLVGATPKYQSMSQICGALAGSFMGTAAYMMLLPDPKSQVFTEQFNAPAVATWKAVAELFQVGFRAIPEGTPTAILIAAVFGILLPVLEKVLPKKATLFVPSSAALGLAFVITADNAVSMFLGAVIGLLVSKIAPNWSARFLITVAAGLVAGEAMAGAGVAVHAFLTA